MLEKFIEVMRKQEHVLPKLHWQVVKAIINL
jgi:hypothetical protein